MSAREDALRRAAEAGGASFSRPVPAPPVARPNLALGRGDVFRPSRRGPMEAVARIEWRGESWAVESYRLAAPDRLTGANHTVRFLAPTATPQKIGRWDGGLYPAAPGRLIPSDGATTVPAGKKSTTPKEADMATVVRKGKTGAKGAAKTKTTAAKTAAPKTAKTAPPEPAAEPTRARRSAEDVAALVPSFVKHLKGGGKMRALKQEHGFSDDGPIRRALYFAGYDSKGNEHGEEADSIDASKAAGKKQLVKLRNEGAGWYRLSYLSGLSEAEVKKLVTEAGGSESRVYVASDKPKATKAAKKAETPEDAVEADKAEAAQRKPTTGKRVSRRATKADPSKQG